MTPQEREAFEQREATRQAARAKWSDGNQPIETGDLAHFSGDEIKSLANAGRLVHLGIGADKRTRR